MEKAIFGAGCFWGVEEAFRKIPGVQSTAVGYSGGTTENPTYQDVCAHETGHVEVVEIDFDPDQVSYEALVRSFFDIHDPTTPNRQGPDVGSQYRSAIFYGSEEQKTVADGIKTELQQSGKNNGDIVTEITPTGPFYRAEEYHQQYIEKRGQQQHT